MVSLVSTFPSFEAPTTCVTCPGSVTTVFIPIRLGKLSNGRTQLLSVASFLSDSYGHYYECVSDVSWTGVLTAL